MKMIANHRSRSVENKRRRVVWRPSPERALLAMMCLSLGAAAVFEARFEFSHASDVSSLGLAAVVASQRPPNPELPHDRDHDVGARRADTPSIDDADDSHNELFPEHEMSVSPPPEDWEEYSFSEVRHHLDCRSHALDQTKELPTMDNWMLFRRQYNAHVDGSINFENDPVPPTEGYTIQPIEEREEGEEEGGVRHQTPAPFYAKRSEGKGRGVFASRDIKKGEVVHDGTHSDVVFPDAMSWRRFVFSLPREMACDVAEWAWTQRLESGNEGKERGSMKIMMAPNISSLMNSSSEPNVLPKKDTSSRMYATVDIKEGEEIFMDYEIYDTDWEAAGLTF